jgi:hypothetical protein
MNLRVVRDKNFVTGVLLVIFAVLVGMEIREIPATEVRFLARATFFPYVVSIGCFITGLLLVIKACKAGEISEFVWWSSRKEFFVLLTFVIFIFMYVKVINQLGFILTNFFFLVCSMFLLKEPNKIHLFLFSVGTTVLIQVVFGALLKVPLPTGILGF